MNASQTKRVVVTGLGIVSSVGLGKDAFWDGILGPAPEGDRRVTDFDPNEYFGPKEVRRADRFTQFAVAAAEMCLADAGNPTFDLDRAGVFIASGVGGLQTLEDQIQVRLEKGEKRVFGQMVVFEDRRGTKMFERYGFKVLNKAEITKYRDIHPHPVYLCTVIKDLEENSQLYAKAS